MSKRPKYSKKRAKIGEIAETFYCMWLNENLPEKFNFYWHNNPTHEKGKYKDSCLDWDFTILYKNKPIKLIEVESKSYEYRSKFEKEGIDFLENKCLEKTYPMRCDYVLVISDFKNFYWLPMIEVARRGQCIPKNTKAGTKNERFIRVKLNDCNEVKT